MARNMRSRKAAGTRFESQVVQYLKDHVDDGIERRAKSGSKDRGDVTGLFHLGQRIVIECKNHTKMSLGPWANEAETERGNDDAGVGIIAHKRHGKGAPAEQWVTMTLADLVALLTGEPKPLQ